MTIDAAEIARLREYQKSGRPALWSTTLFLLDELERAYGAYGNVKAVMHKHEESLTKANEDLSVFMQSNAALTDEVLSLRAEFDQAVGCMNDRASERDAAHALLRKVMTTLGPFETEEGTWAASMDARYHPGVTEPNHKVAYAKAEFSIGDLRKVRDLRARIAKLLGTER